MFGTMRNIGFVVTLFVIGLAISACQTRIEIADYSNEEFAISPDYKDVTIPYNIAPLCFSVEDLSEAGLIVRHANDSLCLIAKDGAFNLPLREWRTLTADAKGDSVSFTICKKENDVWIASKPFSVYVSEDAIDPYLVYRRLNPGYGLWNRMGIYQRCLEDFEEHVIYDNEEGRGNCINCHSFCEGSPEKWQVHIRTKSGGTYLFDGKEQRLLNLKDKSRGNPVYANWHPSGKFIAYSNNTTFFLIHTKKINRWEVMDEASDVFVADIESGEQYRCDLISSKQALETFPCFSPDGKYLYFCSAEAEEDVISNYDSIQYNLCRIAFDAEKKSFGNIVDTLYFAKRDNGSASFPRISPDGKFLCFTRSEYGNFSICHRDADLCMINLNGCYSSQIDEVTPSYIKLENANSEQVESFHSWSRNSHWLVFSSKREDAIYTRPYFVHIDDNGKATKPFLLPQLDAKNRYDLEMDCYNLPELVSGKIFIDKVELKDNKDTNQKQISVN